MFSLYLSGSPLLRLLLSSSSHLKVTTDIAGGGGGEIWDIFRAAAVLRSLWSWEPFKFRLMVELKAVKYKKDNMSIVNKIVIYKCKMIELSSSSGIL